MLPLADVMSSQQPASSSSSLSVTSQSSQSVRSKVSVAQRRMSDDHDRRHRAKLPLIKSGDFVRIKLPIVSHKLTSIRNLLSKSLATQFGFRTVSVGMCDDACFVSQYSRNLRRKSCLRSSHLSERHRVLRRMLLCPSVCVCSSSSSSLRSNCVARSACVGLVISYLRLFINCFDYCGYGIALNAQFRQSA